MCHFIIICGPNCLMYLNKLQFFVQVLLSELPLLDVDQCSFQVEKSREGTARIVGWRHMGIKNAYTLESSLAGSDQHLMQVRIRPIFPHLHKIRGPRNILKVTLLL